MKPRSILSTMLTLLLAGCAASTADPSTANPSTSPASSPSAASAAAPGPSDTPEPRAVDVVAYRGDAARSGNMPGPGPEGTPRILWTFKAGAPIGSQAVVVGTTVYVVSTDGTLHAVDLDNGTEQWSVEVGADALGSPEIADGLLIVGADDGAHAFALDDGAERWAATETGTVRGAPAIVAHTAIFASNDGLATALDTRTGTVLWTRTLDAPDDTSVAASDDLAILGLQDGTVVALAVSDGTERWRTDTGDGARIGTPTIAGGRVYIATLDGGGPGTRHIAALDLATGRVLWRFASPGDKPSYTPAVADGRAITEGEDGSVTALDETNGAVLWQVKAPGLVEVVPAVAGGVLYGASNGGVAFALDAATGAERWQVPIKGTPYGVAVTSGLVIVGTDLGNLYAIGMAAP